MVGWNVTKLHTVTAGGIVMILMRLGMLKILCSLPCIWISLLFVWPCFEAVFLSSICITNCMYCSSAKMVNLSLEVDLTPDTMNQFNTVYSFRYIYLINCILHVVLSYTTSCCNPISQRGLLPSSFVCAMGTETPCNID